MFVSECSLVYWLMWEKVGLDFVNSRVIALAGVRVCESAFKCPVPWSLFTGRRGDSDSRCSEAPDASLNPPCAIHAWSPEESKWRHG